MKNIIFASLLSAIILLVNCSKSTDSKNNPPHISSLTANPTEVEPNGSSSIACTASDPDGDALTYVWSATSGSINGSGSNVTWIAPGNEGTFSITCEVQDGKGGQDSKFVNIPVEQARRNLLYLKKGDPASWTSSSNSGNQSREIQEWESAGYTVDARNASTTELTPELLSNYDVLRVTTYGWSTNYYTAQEGNAVYDWVLNGGKFLAGVAVNSEIEIIAPFGVASIDGAQGGSTGLDWYFHGAPWTFGPVTGPVGTISTFAAEAMDHPVLSSGYTLTIDASVGGYPTIVHGEFGNGKVVIVFPSGWSHTKTHPGNAYRANITQADNLQFLQNVIDYLD